MKRSYLFRFLFLLYIPLSFFSCKKKETFDPYAYDHERLTELVPLQTGKYITYHVDSLIFPGFALTSEVHSYQIKHVIDAEFTDNTGRPSFRVFRYIRDAAGTQEWTPNGTYYITVLDNQVELVEDNLRIIKLHLPVRKEFEWSGNRYLPEDAYKPLGYTFSNDDNMKIWDFTYTGVDETVDINQQPINDVTSVTQFEEMNVPDTVYVDANNKAILPVSPNKTNTVWIKGTATTDPITVVIPANHTWKKLILANQANKKLSFDTYSLLPGFTRTFELSNNAWLSDDFSVVENGPAYGSMYRAKEKYAKGIGLVERHYDLWEFQPNPNGNAFYVGFGVSMWMIDHN